MFVWLDVDLQITFFFKNKHFELCCFVMYRVHNIVNRKKMMSYVIVSEGHGHPLMLIKC
jgi:hypothetical protein